MLAALADFIDEAGAQRQPVGMDANLAEKYRPATFDEVIGQGESVEQLKALVRNGHRRHILFVGPSGSGKTTLAKLYAKSLQCREPRPDGQFCGVCESCDNFDGGLDFQPINSGLRGKKDTVEACYRLRGAVPLYGARIYVFFFDEAQALSQEAINALHQPLEINPPPFIFLFGTIDRDALPHSLQMRCREIRLVAPSEAEAIKYLQRVCAAEKLTVTPDALLLIAALGGGYRDLARHLERAAAGVGEGQQLEAEAVRAALHHDRSHRLIAYFEALASGDIDAQLELTETSTLNPTEILRAIQDVIIHLGQSYIGPYENTPASGLMSLIIDHGSWQRLALIFEQRAKALALPLLTLFDAVVEFWLRAPLHVSKQTLRLLLLRFNSVMHASLGDLQGLSNETSTGGSAAVRTVYHSSIARRQPGVRRPSKTIGKEQATGHYLDFDTTREIYEASSFLVQETGRTFNGWIVIDWTALGYQIDEQAADLCGALLNDLRKQLRLWAGIAQPHHLYRIALHERRTSGAFVSTVVMHVPPDLQARAKAWVLKHRAEVLERMKVVAADGLTVEFMHPTSGRERMKRHWKYVRGLWCGVHPELRAKYMDGREEPLRTTLKIEGQPRDIGRVGCRRFSITQKIAEGARDAAKADRMPHWSFFAEGRWDDMFSGWELKAHELRERERATRRMQIATFEDVSQVQSKDVSRLLIESKLQELKGKWIWPERAPVW